MKKAHYFNPDSFVDDVIKAMKLGKTSEAALAALREEIEQLLSERIVTSVISCFGTRELNLFEKMLEDHPELDEIDALMIMGPEVPGVKEYLERQIQSLFFELTRDADEIGKRMKPVSV
jgi:hypothetical protein